MTAIVELTQAQHDQVNLVCQKQKTTEVLPSTKYYLEVYLN